MRLSNIVLPLAALGLLLVLHPAHAAAPKDNCTGFINTVPAVISTPGTWCLSQNVTTSIASGDAITVASDDVVVDCNDFAIDGQGAGTATTANGIHAIGRNRTVVRHCTVRGFSNGILSEGLGERALVEDNLLEHNRHTGIIVLTNDAIVRRNVVTDTGNFSGSPASNAYGITANADSGNTGRYEILDNTISGVQAAVGSHKGVMGIDTTSEIDGTVIRGNRVGGLKPDASWSYGIYVGDSKRASVRHNEVVGDGSTTEVNVAIDCTDAFGAGLPGVRAGNNVMSGFAYSFNTDCGDAGRNDFNP